MKGGGAQPITTDEALPSPSSQQGHASWYAQGHSDPIGDRLLMFDNSRGPSLELLRFSWRVTGSADFEAALRERVDLLSQFRHPAFARIRAVEILAPQQDLTLVSNYVAGKRLSESFAALRGPVFAAWLIRELVPALAEFQEHARGLAHGALTGNRIVLTSEGRLVIVEHVLGSALQRLQLRPDDLWLRLGIATPPTQTAVAALDPQADVFQVALLAIAVLIGRPLASYEYPRQVEATLATFERTNGQGLPSPLHAWLLRALHLSGRPFESARDAQNALGDLQLPPSNVELLGARMLGAAARSVEQAKWALQAAEEKRVEPPPVRKLTTEPPAVVELNEPRELNEPYERGEPNARRTISFEFLRRARADLRTYLLPAVVALAVVQMGYIAYLLYVKPPTIVVQAPPSAPLRTADPVPSPPRQAPSSPLSLSALAPAVETRSRAASPSAAPVRTGGLRIVSPLELQVLEGDRVLGSSVAGPIVAPAGRRELELVNNALGYRARRVVNFRAGEVATVSVPHPEGRISINATPWADIWIDGVHVGETPLANLSIPIGEHEVSFRHPSFGEQRRTAVVRFDAPTRVSADLR